jgi:hypothetical protein
LVGEYPDRYFDEKLSGEAAQWDMEKSLQLCSEFTPTFPPYFDSNSELCGGDLNRMSLNFDLPLGEV